MSTIELIIDNATVITMEGEGLGIIENGAVGVDGNRIVAVAQSEVVRRDYTAHRTIDASHKVVMPGLIDAHMHSGLGILRGIAQDTDNWMEKGLWPFMQFLTPEQRKAGSLVNIIEGLKAGTTTFGDYDSGMNTIVQNHIALGTRAHVCDMINEMPERMSDSRQVGDLYPLDPTVGEKKLQDNLTLIENYHGSENGRITCLFGPQGPDMMSKELLLEVQNLAKKFDTPIHMHVAQGDREIDQMVKRHGKRSIPYLEEIGYLDERLMAVHLTEATPEEAKTVARSGAAMLLCSGSIGIIDGIVPPAAEFLETSNRLALGSDQAPGNNCNNMFNEMKFTSILNKCRNGDPRAFPAWQMLKSVTINAAQAIGLGEDIGSLKPGKKADVIILDLDSPAMFPTIQAPIRNIVPNLVYSANGSEVETVIIDGQVVVDEKIVQTVDEQQAVVDGQEHANDLASQVRGVDTPLTKMMTDGLL
ncbi:amidohydrolase [Salicibibacter halophilus]|uniref:Amidohydrolase n=1 Tax=Salicibibacter halophilus TaxID=2502791 RepID=A0A514LLW8_9BACI|nr:amidohydrolase [Salicibibacter halophilus]QDI92251.1 amidohydrolase [Salicibibacter halophilus]